MHYLFIILRLSLCWAVAFLYCTFCAFSRYDVGPSRWWALCWALELKWGGNTTVFGLRELTVYWQTNVNQTMLWMGVSTDWVKCLEGKVLGSLTACERRDRPGPGVGGDCPEKLTSHEQIGLEGRGSISERRKFWGRNMIYLLEELKEGQGTEHREKDSDVGWVWTTLPGALAPLMMGFSLPREIESHWKIWSLSWWSNRHSEKITLAEKEGNRKTN